MESTCQLLRNSHATSNLLGGRNGRGRMLLSFQKNDAPVVLYISKSLYFSTRSNMIDAVQCVSVARTTWSGRQLERSHVFFSFFLGDSRCEQHSNLPPARVSTNPSGTDIAFTGKPESEDRLWDKYFADPSQWWDNRVNKRNHRAPDFKHKFTGEALWIVNASTPQWVKAMLKEVSGAREAVAILKDRIHQGISIDPNTYVDVLKRCSKQKDLVSAKEVHHFMVKGGIDQNPYAANHLLGVYIRCGRLQNARQVFDKLGKKNVFSWTTMIGGYAEYDQAQNAMEVYCRMRQGGCQPNEVTYLSILKAFVNPGALKWGKEIHAHIRNRGLQSDVRVGNALLSMYAKCGSIDDARLVFDKMVKRNIISWNAMIGGLVQHSCGHEAFSLFLQMQKQGFVPNSTTYMSILNADASTGALEWVKEVHKQAVKAELAFDLRVGTALIHMYAKSDSIDDARLVFNRMVERDIITWNAMIGGLAQRGCGQEAYNLFLQMVREGFVPDATTYVSILNASSNTGALEWVREVHAHAAKAGRASDLRVGNALVHMYAKCSSIDDARRVFDRMVDRDLITWNVIIGGLTQHGCGHEAFSLFLQMLREGFAPDATTYVSLLSASTANNGAMEWVQDVHSYAVKAGLDSNLRVGNALVHIYAKSDNIDAARRVFDRMVVRDVHSWTVMIGALAQHGYGHEAFSLFLQMLREGFVPDAPTYVSILNASASEGALEWVKEVHRHALQAGLAFELRVGSALVHMYAKIGSIDDAKLVFDTMVERDVVSWNVMIGGLAQHGLGEEALHQFGEMKAKGLKPDASSFVAVLSACSHAGLVDEGRSQFLSMKQDYGIEPTIEHYTCMVDVLGRAGYLEEAKHLILNMPLESAGAPWGALLGACRTHNNLKLAEYVAQVRFELEPQDASTYVLLSNIYAAAGKWDQVVMVRRMMQERGIRKEPGRSWIEVDNKIHDFVAGDTSHPEAKEIYAELNNLIGKLKAAGYIPDTRLVLRNIDEEDKELALCSHSEKLAIAYGFMHTPAEKPIRIYKNLRVCSDCHTATKLISKVTGREILARDANRFHHFKDGVCSCGDYW